jgi:hypothetical protein
MTRRLLIASAIAVLSAGLAAGAQQQQRDVKPATPAKPVLPVATTNMVVRVVSDEDPTQPMRRVAVSVQAGEIDLPRTAVTDEQGRAVIAVPAGNYFVVAAKPGYVRTHYGSKTPGRGPGIAVAVIAGKPVAEMTLRLIRGGVISGTIRSAGGKPVPNLRVQAVSSAAVRFTDLMAAGEAMLNMSTTDDRGMYRIYGLAPGTYSVVAQVNSGAEIRPVTQEQLQWADRVSGGNALTLPADAVAPPEPAPRGAYAPVYYPGTALAQSAAPIRIGPNEERLGVDFPLQLVPTARIRGRLLDEQGRPQPGAQLTLRQQAGAAAQMDQMAIIGAMLGGGTSTQPDGTFVLEAVTPGEYTLNAQATIKDAAAPAAGAPGIGPILGGFGGRFTHWASEPLSVLGRDITDLVLVLRPGMTIAGRIEHEGTTLEKPKDLTGIQLSLAEAGSGGTNPIADMLQSMMGSTQLTVAKDGTFTGAGIRPGQYKLNTLSSVLTQFIAPSQTTTSGWQLKSVIVNGVDVADTAIDVRPGENLTDVVVMFTDKLAELSGTVYDQAGRVTPNFPIIVFSTNEAHWRQGSRRTRQVRPATDGTFRVMGLPAGEYYVSAVTSVEQSDLADPEFLRQLAAASFRITLKDAEQKTQDLKLGGGGF